MSIATTPEWVKHAIFYQIFPDRFASSATIQKPGFLEPWDTPPTTFGFKGGDLMGVCERLDYLKDLGINAIYFTPILQSTANHRYHTHDYLRVDPILGGDAAFLKLLNQAHKRGIRVVIDGVFNHASRGFYQFNHALENGKSSPYLDWFTFRDFPLNAYSGKIGYEAWWGIPALPKFNTKTPAVREFLFGVAEHWMRFGADGWRLDVAGEIDDDSFWREFRARVKAINPEAYIVGEIWHEAQRWLQGDQFDAVMNYLFTRACMGFFARDKHDSAQIEGSGVAPVPAFDSRGFAHEMNRLLSLYPQAITQSQMNLLDSHDISRFVTYAKGDTSALKLATLFQMTYPGAPSVYYGDEIGLAGGKDPDCRRTFPWDQPLSWDRDLLGWFKSAIQLRKKYVALRTGDFRVLYAEDDVLAYARVLDDERLIVVLNSGMNDALLDVRVAQSLQLMDGTPVREVFGGQARKFVTGGMISNMKVAGRSGVVFKVS